MEKILLAGPRIGSSSLKTRLHFILDQFNGAMSSPTLQFWRIVTGLENMPERRK